MHTEEEKLAVLRTDEALQKKLTMKQFITLTVFTLVIPVIAIIAVGSTLS